MNAGLVDVLAPVNRQGLKVVTKMDFMQEIGWMTIESPLLATVYDKKTDSHLPFENHPLRYKKVFYENVVLELPVDRWEEEMETVEIPKDATYLDVLTIIHSFYKNRDMGDLVWFEGIRKIGGTYCIDLGS